MALMPALLTQAAQMALVLLLAPLLTGFVRLVKARLLRRRGPPLLQPYRDLLRLIRKEVVLADNASWLFRSAPYLIFAATWVAAALVPTFAIGLLYSWSADLIAIIALLGSARFLLALAVLDVGTSFGGIGSSREMMIASLAEPAMLMVIFTVSLLVGTTSLSHIATTLLGTSVGLRVSLALGLVAITMVAIAENARVPVDNPATHLELTMVHEAMVLEYAGPDLALVELASAMRLSVFLGLLANLFAPWGVATAAAPVAVLVGVVALVVKVGVLGVVLAALISWVVAGLILAPVRAVRQTAAEALGRFGPVARSAEPALRRAMQDEFPEVRAAAGGPYCRFLKENLGLLKNLAFSRGMKVDVSALPPAELDEILDVDLMRRQTMAFGDVIILLQDVPRELIAGADTLYRIGRELAPDLEDHLPELPAIDDLLPDLG